MQNNGQGFPQCCPDEEDYPSALTAQYEILECFSVLPDMQTLLALDRQSGDRCVVKCYHRDYPLFDRTEPEALRNLNAPPLPRFVGEYKNCKMRCVLREYIPGYTLAAVARLRRFDREEIIRIAFGLCEQLELLHGNLPPIIHRDIKPQNVVLRPDGVAVLIDFGISQVYTGQMREPVAYGTEGFAPPEQYGFAVPDARSDIYSLGILLHWLQTGTVEALKQAESDLDRIIVRCCAFDPEQRYADVRQLKADLQKLSSDT